jgi:hypothetical protein
MSIKLSVTANIEAFAQRQINIAKQIEFAGVVALTKTAQQIKIDEVSSMKESFDRPTPFTLNSLALRPATKQRPEAEVFTKLGFGSVPAGRYLNPEVEGGKRSMKSHERKLGSFTAPSRSARLDRYGNFPAPTYLKILSQLRLAGDQSATDSRRSKRKRSGEAFFKQGNIIFSRKKDDITPVLILTESPDYSKRFPFYDTAQSTADRVLEIEFDKALARAFATAK